MGNILQTIKNFAIAHKLITGAILLGAVGVSYGIYSATTAGTAQAKYVLATVERGTVVSSISGSGQVAVSRSIDVKAKAQGDVTYVAAKEGQGVYAGQLLAIIDPTNAEKAVRDAETSLAKAKLDLQKLQGGETPIGTFRGATDKAVADLDKIYADTLSELSLLFFDYPGIVNGFETILLSDNLAGEKIWNISYYANSIGSFNSLAQSYKDKAIADWQNAKNSYNKAAGEYKNISLASDRGNLDNMIQSAYQTSKLISVAIKDAADLIQLYRDELKANDIAPNTASESHLASIATYAGKISSHLSQLNSLKSSTQNQKEAVFNAGISIADQEIKVRQAEDVLTDAKTDLANHYVRAPFAGFISKVHVEKYDTVSGAVATLLTKEMVAQLALNEIDAVKVKTGQKATLAFDAISDFNIMGEVADVDISGAVNQGVVTYSMTVAFSSNDARIKPGMSVSATIVTDSKTDVLVIPTSAIKSIGRNSVVSIVDEKVPQTTANLQGILLPNPPRPQKVETGISDDIFIEIVSGLKEGDQIVVRTVTGAAAKNTPAQSGNGLFQVGTGGRGGATGAVRIQGSGGGASMGR